MHETALVQDMLSIAHHALTKRRIRKVQTIKLAVGVLANVMPDALLFAFEAMSKNSIFEEATLEMTSIPVGVRCDSCGFDYEPSRFPYTCPVCQSTLFKIIQGEEFYIISLVCDEYEGREDYV